MILTLWNHFLTILTKLIQQVRLNSTCRYKMKTGLSFETLSSNSKMVRLQYMLLVSPLTVSHMFYLLVAILEKVSIIYHIIYHMVILMKNLILGQQNKEITLLLQTINLL